MSGTILLFDLGNTNIKIGLARPGQGLLASYALPSSLAETADSLGLRLMDIARHAGIKEGEVEDLVACSVVPGLDPVLAEASRRYFGRQMRFAAQDLAVPLENRYERPAEVGADRLVAAYAASALFPAPGHIVVDFGTATTFDCEVNGAYLGGLICPGLLSSARALAVGTAKLPQINLDATCDRLAVGRSTSESLRQGFVFGFAAMAEGLCERLKDVLAEAGCPRQGIRVVAAGGLAPAAAKVTTAFDEVRPDLLLEGLFLLYEGVAATTGSLFFPAASRP